MTLLRQLLYISSSCPRGQVIDVAPILLVSRRNNALDGVTGLLWTDGERFLQVLEGSPEAVAATFARIVADERHTAIVTLGDRMIAEREFGSRSMQRREPGDADDGFETRMRRALEGVAPAVRGTFEGLISARNG